MVHAGPLVSGVSDRVRLLSRYPRQTSARLAEHRSPVLAAAGRTRTYRLGLIHRCKVMPFALNGR